MQITEKMMLEFKEIYRKEHGKELSDEEAYENARSLIGFTKTVYDYAVEEEGRKRRLAREPEGFALDTASHQYTCKICEQNTPGNQMWYDQYGQGEDRCPKH